MSMLRILTGYLTEDYREEVPTVLFIGRDADLALSAAETADAKYLRIELLEVRGGKRLRKGAPLLNGMHFSGEAIRRGLGSSESEKPPEPPPVVLEERTVEELRALAKSEDIDLAGLHLKAEIIDAITLARMPLAERTIEQLRTLAEAEEIDLTGRHLKAEIVDAIEAARKKPVSPPVTETPAAGPIAGAAAASAEAEDDGPSLLPSPPLKRR